MKPVEVEARASLTCDPARLWPLLTDTERLNRATGNAPVAFEPLSDDSAARFLGKTHLGGFDVQYEERPFEWSYLESFHVERRMRSGPVEAVDVRFTLRQAGAGTEVTIRLAMTPRLFFLAPVLRYRATTAARRIAREFERIDRALASDRPTALPAHPSLRRDALDRAARLLREGSPGEAAAKIVSLVELGEDVEVAKMRPFELADAWGLDRTETLDAFLRAVRAGLLELTWDVVCPSCRVASSSLPSLSALESHGSCQVCELEFSVDLDDAVEATFTPAEGIRKVDRGPYCSGGPARTPHVLAQKIAPAHGRAALKAPPAVGAYRLFARGGHTASAEVSTDGPAQASLAIGADGELTPRRVSVCPGGEITLENGASREVHVKLERIEWARKAATARAVTSLAAFRDQFAGDTLKPGLSLRVSRVAILFSDLVGSTQLYSDVGDGKAFRLVLDHFDLVGEIIARRRGTIVKTIGDAVMAVFADELDAATAGIEIALAFRAFREGSPERRRTDIKLGVYSGACYAVTANGILDYFGQTVNVAARLQAEAKSGEVVVEKRLADALRDRGAIPPGASLTEYDAHLKGLEAPLRAARIEVMRST
ncbi:MAG: DUF5939 domain-containing protein [Polyangiaceae bacterium]